MSSQESRIDLILKPSAALSESLSKQGAPFTLLIMESVAPAPYFQPAGIQEGRDGGDLQANLCAEIIGECKGTILRTSGDALIAVFRETAFAVRAAAKIQRRLSHISQFLPEEERVELRIGIHAGGSRRAGSDVSTAISVAARIAKGSGPAQILISSSTLAESVLDKDLRSNWIGKLLEEGNARPEDLFEIIWTDSSAYRELRSQVTASFAQGKLVCPGTEVSDLFESTATKAAEDEGRETASLDLSLAPWPVTLPQRYEVLQELGRGGMGVVYKAHDRETGEILAVKVLKPDIAGDPAGMERFKNELRLARRVTHKNVCRIYEFNRAGGAAFITMELIDGITLHDFVRQRGRLTAEEGVPIARQICAALREAHHQGIIHRDLKPSNIMIDRDGNAKIMDFGIARSLDASVTVTGMVLGTPAYMAPEQAEGRSVDARTDIYLLGLILYEIFTGTVAFSGDTPFLIALKQMREFPPTPRQIDPNLPTYLDNVVMRCLQKDASLRFPSVDELEAALVIEPPSAETGGRKVQVEGS